MSDPMVTENVEIVELVEVVDMQSEPQIRNSETSEQAAGEEINIRVVIRDRGRYFCHLVPFSTVKDSGVPLKRFLETQYYHPHRSRLLRLLSALGRGLTMQAVAVQTAIIVPVDLEQQACPQEVLVQSVESNTFLEDMLGGEPGLHRAPTLLRNLSFATQQSSELSIQYSEKSLSVGLAFSKRRACVWLGVAFLVSLFLSVLAGVLAHRAATGLAIGTGVLGLLETTQGGIIWMIS